MMYCCKKIYMYFWVKDVIVLHHAHVQFKQVDTVETHTLAGVIICDSL